MKLSACLFPTVARSGQAEATISELGTGLSLWQGPKDLGQHLLHSRRLKGKVELKFESRHYDMGCDHPKLCFNCCTKHFLLHKLF